MNDIDRMASIEYKKAFDMVPIVAWRKVWCLENMQKMLGNSMKKLKTELTSGGQKLGTMRITKGTFQGDSLPPLLFALVLTPMSLMLRWVKAGRSTRKSLSPFHGSPKVVRTERKVDWHTSQHSMNIWRRHWNGIRDK